MLEAARASVETAKVQLSYTRIVAPINGVAGVRAVDPGNVVGVGKPIVTLTRVHPVYVAFHLPERDLEPVRRAMKSEKSLKVSVFDRTDSHPIDVSGLLKVVDNQIDTSTGTFRLRALFGNRDNNLWPGQFVNVRLNVRTVMGGLVIPRQAVQRGPGGDYVYVLTKDKTGTTVRMQSVTVVNAADKGYLLVRDGVKLGQSLVVEGQFRIKPGIRVKALPAGRLPH